MHNYSGLALLGEHMIIKNPQPFPEQWPTSHLAIEEIYNTDTSPDMQAIPKEEAKREKAVLQEWTPPQHEWTPPAYFQSSSQVEETRFERICKTWFVKIMFVLLILYVLALISIFLCKLFMLVVALK